LNKEVGLTLILTEQHIKVARELAHKFIIMETGRIVAQGAIAELTDEMIEEYMAI
jgi:urea transport system ATP-binding protein